MSGPAPLSRVLHFGPFELNVASGELRKSGIALKLRPQAAKVLVLLVTRPGQMVTREQIKEQVWGSGLFVDFQHGLNLCIQQIRAALGDDADRPRYIETVPRHGYRFIAQVEERVSDPSPSPQVSATDKGPEGRLQNRARWWTRSRVMVGVAVAAMSALVAVFVGLAWKFEWSRSGPPATRIMLAVLPVQNLSGDAEQEFVTDGLTEEMISQLGRLNPEELGVIARTSAMTYKGSHKSVDQIARDLRVNYLLEASLRRRGERLHITAQLIRASDQTHVWAHNYDPALGDIVAMQAEVARAIAQEIQVSLTPQAQARLARARSIESAAYQAYLKGRYFWNKRTQQGLMKAIEYFQLAIDKDPANALAYAGLADSYNMLGNWGALPTQEVYKRAKAAATKALELDESLGEVHSALAVTELLFNWDWSDAEKEFERALELNPDYAPAHEWYALYLSSLGRHKEALTEARRAQELEPLSLIIDAHVGWTLYYARQYDQAIEQCRKTLDMDPNFYPAHLYLGRAYLGKGRYEEAVSEFEKARGLAGQEKASSVELGYAYAAKGRGGDALEELHQMEELWKRTNLPVYPYHMGLTYAGLGNKEQALEWLKEAYRQRYAWLIMLREEPRLDGLRSDPRFQDLLRRLALPA